jgi:hypothetical protein
MAKKMDMERCNLKQINEEEVKEQCQVTIKNKFAAMENLIMGTSIWRGKVIERTLKFRPKKLSVFVNRSHINHSLMRNV